MNTAFWLSLVVFLLSLGLLLYLAGGVRKVRWLSAISPELGDNPPKVSIIFAALNEADTIEPALRSVLALDYPNLEIIAINDRSTDATGEILDRIGRAHPALRVLHIKELPVGWLGKNHALQRGAEMATGDYLLFTDADVVFAPTAMRRAVFHCERERLDHLVVMAEFIVREHLLAMLLINGSIFMFATLRPWKLRTSASAYMGIGAFNMVRASAYRQAGGHRLLALEVIDDLMLGRLMKTKGFSQDAVFGYGMVAVEWYRSAMDMVRGLEKNSFAMMDYRVSRLLVATVLILLVRYWPWVGLFVTSGATWWLCVAGLVLNLILVVGLLRPTGWSLRCLVYWPFAPLLSLLMLWRGVMLTLMRGGIYWRGTRYPLGELVRARRGRTG